jgi:hypothetical protein
VKVALVGCGKRKAPGRRPARYLYTGALFVKALALAPRLAPRVLVLSALHRVVELDQELDPYEHGMDDVEDPDAWAELCCGDLRRLVDRPAGEPLVLVVLAGAAYAGPLAAAAARWGWEVEEPLRGLAQGPRLRRLNELLAGRAP